MKIQKTKFASYCSKEGIAKGCKYCVKGQKLVFFISGVCSRNCWYCSLSNKRKNVDKMWANEREVNEINEIIEEVEESNAKGMGITGGDPLLFLNKTIKISKEMKREFGKKFHIHIYLPTKLVDKNKLKKLKCCIDEVRFHPDFLCNGNESTEKDIEKIKTASELFGRQNTGVELPMIPENKKEILDFIKNLSDYIGFVNLNELEISETNFVSMTKKYEFDKEGYVVKGSKEAGLWILNELSKNKINIRAHLCTAELKNWHQYKNRLLQHKILPFGKKTQDGTVIYFFVNGKINGGFYDKIKKRTIINPKDVKKLIKKHKIKRIEEYPTFDRDEINSEEV